MNRLNEKLEEDPLGKYTLYKDDFHLYEDIYKLQSKNTNKSIIIIALITIIIELGIYIMEKV